ncbi:MAG: hypothetical protein JST47_06860 [Bacteroidetes bacterium]|nr:hypothetical protein [Bacteroidota bacterium]
MIPLNELRIGNFIKGPLTLNGAFYPDISPIKPIELQLKLDHFLWFKANPELYQSIEPILLTEEWMRKFSSAREHELKWELHQYITVVKRYDKFFLHFSDKGLIHGVKYVHQLQNLCFALTGEELVLHENKAMAMH